MAVSILFYFNFLKDFIYLLIYRGGEGREKGGRKTYEVASHAPPTGNLAGNPGMCPD